MSFIFPTIQFLLQSRARICSFLRKIWRGIWVPAYLSTVVFPLQSYAQVATAIIPDATLPTNSSVTQIAETFHVTDGTSVGSNLFHSFDTFHVGTEDTANFVNPGGIDNILSRVTGGAVSNIFGTLQSESSANVFFLNPSGVVFGPTAQLNVNGSFHVSTADSINLGEGLGAGIFSATDLVSDILTVAPPSAFGFLESVARPPEVTVDQSLLLVPSGETLSIVGGNIDILGATLVAPNGNINLASVTSIGEVPVRPADLQVENFESLGNINITESPLLDTSGAEGGTVVIRGGRLLVGGSTLVSSTTLGAENGSTPGIDLEVAEDIHLENGAVILTDTQGEGNARNIFLKTEILELNESVVLSNSTSKGNAGSVGIDVDQLSLTKGALIGSSSDASGKAGVVTVQATDSVSVLGRDSAGARSLIFSTTRGDGDAGGISLSTRALRLDAGVISGGTTAGGGGGDIGITVDQLTLTGGALIENTTFGEGKGGTVAVEAKESLSISGETDDGFPSSILSLAFDKGDAGNIFLSSRNLTIDGGTILATSSDTGNAGSIELRAGQVTLINGARIDSSTFGFGEGGTVIVNASEAVSISGSNSEDAFSQVRSVSLGFGPEQAGRVSIISPLVVLGEGGILAANSFGEAGAGDIMLNVGRLILTGEASITNSTLATKGGGTVTILASESVSVLDKGRVTSSTFNVGEAGHIDISTPVFLLTGGGAIQAVTSSSGDGGNILIRVGEFTIADGAFIDTSTFGVGRGGTVNILATGGVSLDGPGTGVTSSASGEGPGGAVNIQAEQAIQLKAGAVVKVDSEGLGNAGDILLQSGDIIQLVNSSITTGAEHASGGNIKLAAPNIIQLQESTLESSVQGGTETTGGNIDIDPQFVIIQGSNILARATLGNGGQINIEGNVVLVDPFSRIDASSAFGVSGSVDIQAPIQNLSGTIAPLPEDTVPVVALYSARCAAGEGGHFSTFVDSKADSLSPTPGQFLASPLLVSSTQTSIITDVSNVHGSPILLSASITPLFVGQTGESTTACP